MSSDDELFGKVRQSLYTAVVGDIMDTLGLRDQFLPPGFAAVQEGATVLGRAMTVLEADAPFDHCPESRNAAVAIPFGLMFEALDDLKPGEVYICTGSSPTYALWGELMSTRAMALGAAGAVLDGYSRDTLALRTHNFPVFSHGNYGQDQGCRGKVIDYRVPIRIGNVRITPGDIVFGDIDGVCVIPREAEAEVFAAAFAKVEGEDEVRKALEGGMSTVQAFRTFGIM